MRVHQLYRPSWNKVDPSRQRRSMSPHGLALLLDYLFQSAEALRSIPGLRNRCFFVLEVRLRLLARRERVIERES
jgi:hypothetical protein